MNPLKGIFVKREKILIINLLQAGAAAGV